ncbi:hypothetical protein Purlil1_9360 [Purpureocillium lilacinum]|uniref:Uncharacterized protein n=1 Tax=Purpureocillium lilacinum TaxID=33203 RepID=A0ABR0BQI4_PURLI|nr:hypothetical protein Purlil1_9360 [Purpureocillium lilacinum]
MGRSSGRGGRAADGGRTGGPRADVRAVCGDCGAREPLGAVPSVVLCRKGWARLWAARQWGSGLRCGGDGGRAGRNRGNGLEEGGGFWARGTQVAAQAVEIAGGRCKWDLRDGRLERVVGSVEVPKRGDHRRAAASASVEGVCEKGEEEEEEERKGRWGMGRRWIRLGLGAWMGTSMGSSIPPPWMDEWIDGWMAGWLAQSIPSPRLGLPARTPWAAEKQAEPTKRRRTEASQTHGAGDLQRPRASTTCGGRAGERTASTLDDRLTKHHRENGRVLAEALRAGPRITAPPSPMWADSRLATHLQDGFAVRVPPAPTPTPAVPEFMLHAHEHGMALGHGMPLRAHNSTVPNCTSTRRRRRASTQQHSTAPTLTVNDAHHDNDDNRQPTTAKSTLRLRPPPPASKHPSKHPSTGKWQPLSTRTGLRRPKPAKLLPPPLPSPPVAVVIVHARVRDCGTRDGLPAHRAKPNEEGKRSLSREKTGLDANPRLYDDIDEER